jgi:hypothetical protein
MEISCRPLTVDDEPFIKRLIEDVVADELGARLWPDAVLAPLLDIQYRAPGGFRDAFPGATEEIVQRDGAGWLVTARDAESIRVVDIAFLPQERDKGLGTACIRDLQTEAERTIRILRISVVQMNAAARPMNDWVSVLPEAMRLGTRWNGARAPHDGGMGSAVFQRVSRAGVSSGWGRYRPWQ